MCLILAYGGLCTSERPHDAPACRLDWGAHVPGRIFHTLNRTLFPGSLPLMSFAEPARMETLQ